MCMKRAAIVSMYKSILSISRALIYSYVMNNLYLIGKPKIIPILQIWISTS